MYLNSIFIFTLLFFIIYMSILYLFIWIRFFKFYLYYYFFYYPSRDVSQAPVWQPLIYTSLLDQLETMQNYCPSTAGFGLNIYQQNTVVVKVVEVPACCSDD